MLRSIEICCQNSCQHIHTPERSQLNLIYSDINYSLFESTFFKVVKIPFCLVFILFQLNKLCPLATLIDLDSSIRPYAQPRRDQPDHNPLIIHVSNNGSWIYHFVISH